MNHQAIQNPSTVTPMPVKSGQSTILENGFSRTIKRGCRALLIDLPLSTSSRLRSINEQATERKLSERGFKKENNYLYYLPKSPWEVVFKVLDAKSDDGKYQVVLIEHEEHPVNMGELKSIAKSIYKELFSRRRIQNINWLYWDLEGNYTNITKEVLK